MKTQKNLVLLTLFIALVACAGDELPKADPEKYIALLRSNQYTAGEIPSLTEKDIPVLLSHRRDRQVITNFPRNPLSSFHQSECEVGLYLLWNIELVRTMEDVPDILGRFPSLNPMLRRKVADGLEFVPVDDREAYEAVADAYFRWWEDNKQKGFDEFKDIDPLEGMAYRWH